MLVDRRLKGLLGIHRRNRPNMFRDHQVHCWKSSHLWQDHNHCNDLLFCSKWIVRIAHSRHKELSPDILDIIVINLKNNTLQYRRSRDKSTNTNPCLSVSFVYQRLSYYSQTWVDPMIETRGVPWVYNQLKGIKPVLTGISAPHEFLAVYGLVKQRKRQDKLGALDVGNNNVCTR